MTKNKVEEHLLEHAKNIFDLYPDMESFGWHQCTERWVDGRNVIFDESIARPDISGALGELYIERDQRQNVVSSILGFMKDELREAFGDGVDITVYKDLTIEITDDTHRFVAFEF